MAFTKTAIAHTTTTRGGGCEPIHNHNSAVVLPSGSARSHAAEAALDRDLRCSRRAAHSARRELGVSFPISPVTRRGVSDDMTRSAQRAPSTVRPLARDPRVLIGWPFPLGFGLDGRLLLARRGRVYVWFIIIRFAQRDRRTEKLSHWRRPRRCSHL